MNNRPRYNRILLKLGGEALSGQQGHGIDPKQAEWIASLIKSVRNHDIQVAVVIGGGNLWRGATGEAEGMDRATADYIGMLATCMNAMALRDTLERQGVETRVQSAIEMKAITESYIRLRAIRHLEKGRVVILAAGTGNPFFTTDSAAALRGVELHADVLIKATKVNGVYDKDPNLPGNGDAKRYASLTFQEALDKRLKVMDANAFALCMDNHLPILVLNLWEDGALERALMGDQAVGTTIA